MSKTGAPAVGVIMGSDSDYDVMRAAAEALAEFGVAHEVRVVSARRSTWPSTPRPRPGGGCG